MLTEKGGCFHKTFGISLETIKHSLSGMIDKKIRPQASDLLRESVTSFAQLIPTVYSMSSRAMTPDVPLIPSSTICRKNTGVAVNCFQLIHLLRITSMHLLPHTKSHRENRDF